jgi:hypothetical protein
MEGRGSGAIGSRVTTLVTAIGRVLDTESAESRVVAALAVLPIAGLGLVARRMILAHDAIGTPILQAATWDIAAPYALMPLVALLSLAVVLVPKAWLQATQLAALFIVVVGYRALALSRGQLLLWLLIAGIGAFVVKRAPIEKERTKKLVIVASTIVAIPAILIPWGGFQLGLVLRQLAWSSNVLSQSPPSARSWTTCLRSMACSPGYVAPPDDLVRTDRTPRTILSGCVWLTASILMLWALEWPGLITGEPEPLRVLAEGRVLESFVQAGLYAARSLWLTCIFLGLPTAVLRLIGIPVASPFYWPWFTTDFVHYWRRANAWQYKLMYEVYFKNFFPGSGPLFVVGIVAVFAISGMQHVHREQGFDPGLWSRWILEGLIVALNAWWIAYRMRVKIKAYIQSGGKKPKKAPDTVWTRALRVSLAIAGWAVVLIAHGFLLDCIDPSRRGFESMRGRL